MRPAVRPVRPRGLPALLLALLLAVAVLAGCSWGSAGGSTGSPSALGPATSGGSGGSGTSRPSAAQARVVEQRLLDQRARAVRTHDLALFLSRVDRRDPDLVARQTRYFRNLEQLPLQRFDYRVRPAAWQVTPPARWGRDVRVPTITLTTQLRGFDVVPVERTVGFAFAFSGGRARIVADRAPDGRALVLGAPAPWDLTAITVRTAPGVLGVFDAQTVSSAPAVVAAVRDGIASVRRALPFAWAGQVVVYHVRDSSVLDSFTDVPGGALDHLGAITFPTYAVDGGTRVASSRMLLMPSSVAAGQPFLGRITRHELTHVALGTRDDQTPSWLSEGIAEYVAARDLPQAQRIIPTSALSAARGAITGMPVDEDFNGPDQEWHYALSWMALDQVAATEGESRVWELVAALHEARAGDSRARQDEVLRRVLGYDGAELARRAAARIRSVYG